MKIEKSSRLTEQEFIGLSSTDLYGELISNKHNIEFNTQEELAVFLDKLDKESLGPWFYKPTLSYDIPNGVIYLAGITRATLEKLTREDTVKD